jgi:hypothetical protein
MKTQLISLAVVHGQLVVTSRPNLFFNGGSQAIVEGSEVWLYCQVNSRERILAVTWAKDDVSLVQDVPHIRIRRSQDGEVSTYLLVVDGFRSSDSGVYQCSARNLEESGNGIALTLTGT